MGISTRRTGTGTQLWVSPAPAAPPGTRRLQRPTISVGARPNSAACSASSVPPGGPRTDFSSAAPIFTVHLLTLLSQVCESFCRPSPGDRLPRPRSTATAPPARLLSVDSAPTRRIPAMRTREGKQPSGSRVHIVIRSTREAPSYTRVTPAGKPQASPPAGAQAWLARPADAPVENSRCAHSHTDPCPPGSGSVPPNEASDTGSSRVPSRLTHRTRPIGQYRNILLCQGGLPPKPTHSLGIPAALSFTQHNRSLPSQAGTDWFPLVGDLQPDWRLAAW